MSNKKADKRDSQRKDHARRHERTNRGQKNTGKEGQKEGGIPANIIVGRNAVSEALESGREIEKLVIADGTGGSVKRLVALAKERKVRTEYRSRNYLDGIYDGAHQGVIAFASAHEYSTVAEIMKRADESGERPFLIILDDIEDPHNLGAIMRTAECAGAHGIIISRRHAAGLTETVAKSSAGAIEYMKVARVANIARTIDELKEKGLWIAACDMDGENYTEADLKGAIAIVIGNEGSGISRLVKEKCDFTVSIPMLGHISSLNASNAAAILMYEIRRQRDI